MGTLQGVLFSSGGISADSSQVDIGDREVLHSIPSDND